MTPALGLALLLYFPHLHPAEAHLYAHLIVTESRAAGVDPLVTASRAWVESGYRWRVYEPRDKNHGLLQVRKRVFEPRANIREGVRVLAYWQRWHREGRCKLRPAHYSWAHYTWGYRVPLKHRTLDRREMVRVEGLLRRAIRRAWGRAVPGV